MFILKASHTSIKFFFIKAKENYQERKENDEAEAVSFVYDGLAKNAKVWLKFLSELDTREMKTEERLFCTRMKAALTGNTECATLSARPRSFGVIVTRSSG